MAFGLDRVVSRRALPYLEIRPRERDDNIGRSDSRLCEAEVRIPLRSYGSLIRGPDFVAKAFVLRVDHPLGAARRG